MRWIPSFFALSLSALTFTISCPAFAGDLPQLEQKLNGPMDALLKKESGRERIGFEGDFKALQKKSCDTCGSYRLHVPKHVKRDTFMDLTLTFNNNKPVLKGRMLNATQKQLLAEKVKAAYGSVDMSGVETFPFSSIGNDYAVANKKAVNLYVKPVAKAGDNLATQMRLGMGMQILDLSSDQKFALVRLADDGYIAWVERKDIKEGNFSWYKEWENNQQVLYIAESPRVHYGTRLKLVEEMKKSILAEFPDGKTVLIPKTDARVHNSTNLPTPEAILKTAKQYLPKGTHGGGKYLWGGTLGKRLDCSGFVQTTYRMNGVFLPRDADQQKGFTQRVGNTLAQLNELKPGDLVFFSGHRKYPTHVGIYIGDNKVIHSSSKGPYNGVKVSTLVGGGKYDKYLQKIYFGGGRVVRSL